MPPMEPALAALFAGLEARLDAAAGDDLLAASAELVRWPNRIDSKIAGRKASVMMRRLVSKRIEKRPRIPRATNLCLTCHDLHLDRIIRR